VPVAELSAPGRVIEEVAAAPAPVLAPPPVPEPSPAPAPSAPAEDKPAAERASSRAAADEATLPVVVPRQRPRAEAHAADAVIPLVHSPDDPGPEGELAAEPAPEGPVQEGWWKRAFR